MINTGFAASSAVILAVMAAAATAVAVGIGAVVVGPRLTFGGVTAYCLHKKPC